MRFRINLKIFAPYSDAAIYGHSQSHTNPGVKACGLAKLAFPFPLIAT